MVRLLPYYVIPAVCVIVGVAVGYFGGRSSRGIASLFTLIAFVLVGGALEVSWHEGFRLEGAHQLQVMFATSLALAVVTLASFAPAWFAARKWGLLSKVVLTSALVGVPVLTVYPIVALFFLCYIGHDCP